MAQIYLDNSSVIEVTSAMSPEDIAKVLSMDTLVLDHCVGQCGQAPDNARNLFTGEHQTYRSIYDFNKNKVAKGNPLDYSYVRSVADGDKMLASIRDKQTGLPAATLDFNRQSDGTYSIGYVSGYRNKEITPQYYADIAKYLNQYADRITHISSELVKNTTVRDTTDTSQYRDLASKASTQLRVPVDEIRNVDPLGLPRFVTQKQFNEYVQANMPEQAARQQGNIARIERNSELRRQYDALSEEADRAEGLIGHFEMLQDARGLSAEETQTLQAVRDRLEQIINEQITLDAELNPPQDWEPDPTHPANAPIDGLQLFQDLQQPEPRTYEQLMIDANSVIGTIERINERIANATTPEQRAELTNAQRVYVNTLAVINRDMEALQQQREQLPAPPAEVRLQPEQVPPTLLNNDALAARMTNDMLADATPMVEHLREQMEELRRDGEGPDAIRGFLEEVRDNAELYFGEADPLTVEYAIRVAEGTWRPGFAKGGIVKKKVQMTKSIPAMRAELLRRA
jgi:hypothetical protein